MRIAREFPLLMAVALLSTSCAFGTMKLELPRKGLDKTIRGGNARQVIVVMPFMDRRDRRRCGMKKNGYNMDTADVVCTTLPTRWFAELLATELRASGFVVLSEEDEHRPGALKIEGELLQLFVEPLIGAWSGSTETDLSVELTATTETGLVAKRTFFVKGWKGGVMAFTAQPFHTSTHRATQRLLKETVRAVIELMDAYPQLGELSIEGAWRS